MALSTGAIAGIAVGGAVCTLRRSRTTLDKTRQKTEPAACVRFCASGGGHRRNWDSGRRCRTAAAPQEEHRERARGHHDSGQGGR